MKNAFNLRDSDHLYYMDKGVLIKQNVNGLVEYDNSGVVKSAPEFTLSSPNAQQKTINFQTPIPAIDQPDIRREIISPTEVQMPKQLVFDSPIRELDETNIKNMTQQELATYRAKIEIDLEELEKHKLVISTPIKKNKLTQILNEIQTREQELSRRSFFKQLQRLEFQTPFSSRARDESEIRTEIVSSVGMDMERARNNFRISALSPISNSLVLPAKAGDSLLIKCGSYFVHVPITKPLVFDSPTRELDETNIKNMTQQELAIYKATIEREREQLEKHKQIISTPVKKNRLTQTLKEIQTREQELSNIASPRRKPS